MKDIYPTSTIDQVIAALDEIISSAEQNNDPLGYFAVLYRRVTIKVKEGITEGFFDNGPRMEQLDVVFAKRYLDAYYAYHNNQPVTQSWQVAFNLSKNYWPIVMQHLLIGINAHINLDLGIAAAEISKGKDIHALEEDFNKINTILSALVDEVQTNLTYIWSPLRWFLAKTGKLDDHLVDFSMKIARNGAWKFATEMADQENKDREDMIRVRDEKVARKAKIIMRPTWWISLILSIIRLTEKGTVRNKIMRLSGKSKLLV